MIMTTTMIITIMKKHLLNWKMAMTTMVMEMMMIKKTTENLKHN